MTFGNNVAGKARAENRAGICATTPAMLTGSLFKVSPSGQALGAEIRNVDVRSFDSWSFAALMRALLKHQVLLVRGQSLGDHDLAHLRRRLSQANVKLATAHDAPSSFGSLYAIYDALPPALRRRIAHLKIRHRRACANDMTRHADGPDRIASDAIVQPLVCIHPDTGRSMLHLGERHHTALIGLERAESDTLLDELWEFAARAEFAWQCACQRGDLLIWDPRSTMQQRAPETATYPRLLHRAEIWNSISVS
jgi:taurine dioxygenase